jgi:hypothetical protein
MRSLEEIVRVNELAQSNWNQDQKIQARKLLEETINITPDPVIKCKLIEVLELL